MHNMDQLAFPSFEKKSQIKYDATHGFNNESNPIWSYAYYVLMKIKWEHGYISHSTTITEIDIKLTFFLILWFASLDHN